MTPEALEGLLIDRGMGLLPDDVAALLDAYIQSNADARDAARDFDRVAQLVGQAMPRIPAADVSTIPPLRLAAGTATDDRAYVQPVQPRRRFGGMAQVLRLAACLLLGLFAGRQWLGRDPSRPRHGAMGVERTHEVACSAQPSGGGLWSAERIRRAHAIGGGAPRAMHINWNSVVKRPTLKGST